MGFTIRRCIAKFTSHYLVKLRLDLAPPLPDLLRVAFTLFKAGTILAFAIGVDPTFKLGGSLPYIVKNCTKLSINIFSWDIVISPFYRFVVLFKNQTLFTFGAMI